MLTSVRYLLAKPPDRAVMAVRREQVSTKNDGDDDKGNEVDVSRAHRDFASSEGSNWPHEITLDYFYQPHTISILVLAIGGLILTAFLR